jgi:hypothetical protein
LCACRGFPCHRQPFRFHLSVVNGNSPAAQWFPGRTATGQKDRDLVIVVFSLIAAVVVMVVGINAHISGSGHVVAPVNRNGATATGRMSATFVSGPFYG